MAEIERDLSADTSRFQAFVKNRDEEPPSAWQMRASASKVGLLAGIVIAVAIVVALIALTLV